jgi:hypothetical protein
MGENVCNNTLEYITHSNSFRCRCSKITKIEGKEFNKACSQWLVNVPCSYFFSYLSRFLELPSLGNTMKAHISPGNFISPIVPWGRKWGKVSDLFNFHGLSIGRRS